MVVFITSFVARQPIFDREEEVFAYELLYRDSLENSYNPDVDGEEATSHVLTNSFGIIGIEEITEGNYAFVNFTERLICEEIPTIFNANNIVVELLEDIDPKQEVIEACTKLKEMGYIIALDDFIFAPQYQPLVDLADIIKVDFMISSAQERQQLVKIATNKGIDLLAEKVENRAELEEAKEMGYTYFQGYFFSKPVILAGDKLPVYPTNYIRVLNELNKEEPNVTKIAKFIEQDMSLSYKLLKLINSALFSLRKEITSIQQALVLLGLREVKKWFNLIVIEEISNDNDAEVLNISLIRAKFAELLAEHLNVEMNENKCFLMGLFSMIDVLMNREMENLLAELPIAQEIKDGILGEEGIYSEILGLIFSYERGDWEEIRLCCTNRCLTEDEISASYLQSVKWSNDISVSNLDNV